jgi:hypothetical protein
VLYITPDHGTKEFAEDAKKKAAENKGECMIAWYFGHGSKDAKSVQEVKDLLGKANVPTTGDKATAACRAPKYGFGSCYAKKYNDAVAKENQVQGALQEDRPVVGIELAGDFSLNFKQIKDMIKSMCDCCNGKVKMYLYFGAFRKADEPIKGKRPGSFANW